MTRLLLHSLAFTLLAPVAAAAGVPALIVWATGAEAGAPGPLATGVALIVAGACGYVWCAASFLISGRGTPAPYEPPRELVVSGPYRAVRNPMYVSVAAAAAGAAVAFASPATGVYALLLALAFHLRVVMYEEPTLARLFGAAWERYRRETPRWLPRIPRHAAR